MNQFLIFFVTALVAFSLASLFYEKGDLFRQWYFLLFIGAFLGLSIVIMPIGILEDWKTYYLQPGQKEDFLRDLTELGFEPVDSKGEAAYYGKKINFLMWRLAKIEEKYGKPVAHVPKGYEYRKKMRPYLAD